MKRKKKNLKNCSNQKKIKQLFKEWNATNTNYPNNKCIHQLFEEQVQKTPNNIAVDFERLSLSYKELNDRANKLAHYLYTLGVKPKVAEL